MVKPHSKPQHRIGLDGLESTASREDRLNRTINEALSTPAGKTLLGYLRSITIEMVSGPDVSNETLRHLEGQRYLVGLIERRASAAKRGKE